MEYCVYVLYSERNAKIYIGYTTDLISRMKFHNEISKTGWSRNFRPWKVIYVEVFKEKSEALKRESALKGG
jgi:putative endonuclease